MMTKLKYNIKKRIVKQLKVDTMSKFIPNINLDITKNQKKVLLSYLDFVNSSKEIMYHGTNMQSGTCHTNRYELFQIIQVLIQMDFCIDVCWNNEEEAKHYINFKKYDIVIGLGEIFRYAMQHSDAYKIIYMTENPYYISYQREKERVDYYNIRHNAKQKLFRTGMFFKENDEKDVDAIICMGDTSYFSQINTPVKRIYPSAFINTHSIDFSQRKRSSFLVLGTDGFIHKGNDLLVEVFNGHPEWKLFMCGHNTTSEIRKLGLYKSENIIDCGYINVLDKEFEKLAQECTFILLPSCSEAMSTAVLTGMAHGMIPIVSRGIGLDNLNQYCLYFDGYMLDEIERKLSMSVNISEQEIIRRQQEIYKFARDEFSLQKFTERFKEALTQILIEGEQI